MAKKRETKINTLKAFFLGNIRLWFLRWMSPCMNLERWWPAMLKAIADRPLASGFFQRFCFNPFRTGISPETGLTAQGGLVLASVLPHCCWILCK